MLLLPTPPDAFSAADAATQDYLATIVKWHVPDVSCTLDRFFLALLRPPNNLSKPSFSQAQGASSWGVGRARRHHRTTQEVAATTSHHHHRHHRPPTGGGIPPGAAEPPQQGIPETPSTTTGK